jgi:hypothetical protein
LEGRGVVIGQVLDGGVPAPGMPVQLCGEFSQTAFGVCAGLKFKVITDENGYFVINKVAPGSYEVLVVLLPDGWINYWSVYFDIQAGETKDIGFFDIN